MTTDFESDFAELTDHEGAKKHPGYGAFVLDMKGRLYGHEALKDAWAWFEAGWDAATIPADRRVHDPRYATSPAPHPAAVPPAKERCLVRMAPGNPKDQGRCQRGKDHEGGHGLYDIDDAYVAAPGPGVAAEPRQSKSLIVHRLDPLSDAVTRCGKSRKYGPRVSAVLADVTCSLCNRSAPAPSVPPEPGPPTGQKGEGG